MADNKNILIGISGGIACYKIPFLIRLLIKKGYNVRVVATVNALEFVTPLTLRTLCGYEVYTDMFGKYNTSATEHISTAQWADCFVVAPATANIIAKMANGVADDVLSTTYLAYDKPVLICPAMNNNMYFSKSVQRNLKTLLQDGNIIIDSENGFLACGIDGKGRMAEVKEIARKIDEIFEKDKSKTSKTEQTCINDEPLCFEGKVVTITAGPTREKIDSVRFISNNSSGKMGVALAEEFLRLGAKVNLVIGPVSIDLPKSEKLNTVSVVSAEEMFNQATKYAECSDVIICAAAVADYTPEKTFVGKMKKKEDELHLNLVPTKDILKEIGKRKTDKQILVGFALETDNELENAKHKLKSKNLDFIVLNSLKDKGAGFEVDTNKITIIDRNEVVKTFPLKTKAEVSKDIIGIIKNLCEHNLSGR